MMMLQHVFRSSTKYSCADMAYFCMIQSRVYSHYLPAKTPCSSLPIFRFNFSFTGYGIFTSEDIKVGAFIAEYKGTLVSESEGEALEDFCNTQQENGVDNGNFLYFFYHYW